MNWYREELKRGFRRVSEAAQKLAFEREDLARVCARSGADMETCFWFADKAVDLQFGDASEFADAWLDETEHLRAQIRMEVEP